MKKIFSPTLFCLAIACLFFTACEKEQIKTSEIAPIDKEEVARNFLQNSASMLTFAVLEMDHDSYAVNGYVVDKNSNIRTLSIEEATYLSPENIEMSTYFPERMYEKGQVTQEIELLEHADNVKVSRKLKAVESLSINEETNSSKVFFAFKPVISAVEHGNCEGSSSDANIVVNKIVLAASGKYNYTPTLQAEKQLVAWLQSFEIDNSN